MITHSETLGALAAALARAQAKIKHALKDEKNPHFGSDYAPLVNVVDASLPALSAEKIAVIQSPSADGNLVRMTTMLLHESGEWLESDVLQVQAKDAGPQSVGSCLTYLRRYQLSALVGVAPEDDDAEAAEGRATSVPRADAIAPPDAFIDAATGEHLTERPAPPDGYMYIDYYHFEGGWHHVGFLNGNGRLVKYKTKLARVGELAAQAYQRGLPVAPTCKPNDRGGEEGWLNKLELWKVPAEPAPMLTDDDIPFLWLLPAIVSIAGGWLP